MSESVRAGVLSSPRDVCSVSFQLVRGVKLTVIELRSCGARERKCIFPSRGPPRPCRRRNPLARHCTAHSSTHYLPNSRWTSSRPSTFAGHTDSLPAFLETCSSCPSVLHDGMELRGVNWQRMMMMRLRLSSLWERARRGKERGSWRREASAPWRDVWGIPGVRTGSDRRNGRTKVRPFLVT